MATDVLREQYAARPDAPRTDASWLRAVSGALHFFSSLKLTCFLFAVAEFLVFAGSLAQVDMDIWQVMRQYFRTPLAWIDLKVFFPRNWNVGGGFYFPGGITIGAAMLVNLLAAHSLRFKVYARGTRLAAGLAVLAAGGLVSWMVVQSGSSGDGFQGEPILSWASQWRALCWTLAASLVAGTVWLVRFDRRQRPQFFAACCGLAVLAGLVGWLWLNPDFSLSDSSLRILWQLIKGTLAGIVLLVGSWLVFARRAGIVLIHLAVALLMFNELIVSGLHAEGQMPIFENESSNFVKDVRSVELAVVGGSSADLDRVVAIPQSFLVAGRKIAHADLPFDIEIEKYFVNSDVRARRPNDPPLANRGFGEQAFAVEEEQVSGVDTANRSNLAAAYVKLTGKPDGKPLGNYLLWQNRGELDAPETVAVDGQPYDVYLRFKRTYKPYSIHLIDVQRENYPGTEVPKHYSSDVRIVDNSRPEAPIDVQKRIWMNNPLRFAGETFYQSNYIVSDGREMTVLQVVKNSGWMLPYVCCMLAAVGMGWHFLTMLGRFLRRRQDEIGRASQEKGEPASYTVWIVPASLAVAALAYAAYAARVPWVHPNDMRLDAFGRLPVMDGGRVKPMDSLARSSLIAISRRDKLTDASGQPQPAIHWLLDTITHSEAAHRYKIFRIDHPELRSLLGLPDRDGYRYSIVEFRGKLADFENAMAKAKSQPKAKEDAYTTALGELASKLHVVLALSEAFSVPNVREDHALDDLKAAVEQVRLRGDDVALPKAIPPNSSDGKWQSYFAAATWASVMEHAGRPSNSPALEGLAKILLAYQRNDSDAFNRGLADYDRLVSAAAPAGFSPARLSWEGLLNRMHPFGIASYLCFAAMLMLLLSWLGWTLPLRRSATSLLAVALGLLTFALVARVYISGRPPVTNLYSTGPFIGWACLVLGMSLDAVFRMDVGRVTGALAGFSTLLIADYLAMDGDTLNVLQAVLDTQFWLSTHVISINLGYAMTMAVGVLGAVYILRRALDPAFDGPQRDRVNRMIYGTLGFAMFFSFVGTVLGGLWGDDSWGRFWGWDTKENGALMIVLWNALLLHARWGGVVRQAGFAGLAVLGNILVAWSWFGVNQLSVGLHNYGKTAGVTDALYLFAASQILIAAIGFAGVTRGPRATPAAAG